MTQAVPHLQQSIVSASCELRQGRMRCQRPNLLRVSQHGRIEAHLNVADQYAILRGADQQLRASALGDGSYSAKVIFNLQ